MLEGEALWKKVIKIEDGGEAVGVLVKERKVWGSSLDKH